MYRFFINRPIVAMVIAILQVVVGLVTMLGLPGPGWLPAWLGWCAPAAAAWSWLMGLLCWRWGLRHYQGGGG